MTSKNYKSRKFAKRANATVPIKAVSQHDMLKVMCSSCGQSTPHIATTFSLVGDRDVKASCLACVKAAELSKTYAPKRVFEVSDKSE